MVETHFLVENLWSQLYWLFIYPSKYIFPYKKKILIDTHTKIWTEITDIIIFRKKLLKFLQGAPEQIMISVFLTI